jgi:hypothetical protein
MANQNEDPKVEPLIRKEWEAKVSERDARIKELEAQLQSVEKTHAFQAERADKLEADLKVANEKHEFQRKRATRLESTLKDLQKPSEPIAPEGEIVFKGQSYRVLGDFRADNTFAEVKRGHCPEGVTLIAIDKAH